MTHKNDGFIENLMKLPAPLNIRKKIRCNTIIYIERSSSYGF